jgi:hypothetical protein
MTFTTSGMQSFNWQKTWLPCGSSFLMKNSSLPESVARLARRLWLQTQIRLDDCANPKAAIRQNAAKQPPHIQDVARRSIEEAQVLRREVDVLDLAVLDDTQALIGADAQRQDAAHHVPTVGDVAIEQQSWVRNLRHFILWVDVIHKGVDRLREVIGGANVDPRSCEDSAANQNTIRGVVR